MCQENYSLKNDGTKQPRSNRCWTIITNFSAECCFSEYARYFICKHWNGALMYIKRKEWIPKLKSDKFAIII